LIMSCVRLPRFWTLRLIGCLEAKVERPNFALAHCDQTS
jgi:hypothetical protein